MGFAPTPRLSQSRMLTVTLWPHSDQIDAPLGNAPSKKPFCRRLGSLAPSEAKMAAHTGNAPVLVDRQSTMLLLHQ